MRLERLLTLHLLQNMMAVLIIFYSGSFFSVQKLIKSF
ncbi:unnamed protein product [Onchocerca flexuosa]|uniref:CPBP family intramembrane metalloprotease n=1 Tax=Onchocerca flexuosa TaxID=387005 RepID=A0A183I3N7_9BILA|nr:unnamed protein product [Onchocerca flexuosa]